MLCTTLTLIWGCEKFTWVPPGRVRWFVAPLHIVLHGAFRRPTHRPSVRNTGRVPHGSESPFSVRPSSRTYSNHTFVTYPTKINHSICKQLVLTLPRPFINTWRASEPYSVHEPCVAFHHVTFHGRQQKLMHTE